jgi:phosphate transport system protein
MALTLHGAQCNIEGSCAVPRIHFHQQLDTLKEKLLGMAALAQEAVQAAVDAYLHRDAALCSSVRDKEDAINRIHREVDEMAYELLAKEQPMAVDLRFILAVIKINSDLERIGDQSMTIARRALELLDVESVELPADIVGMCEVASRMIRTAIQALIDADAPMADAVIRMDDEIDRMNSFARKGLIGVIQQRPEVTIQALNGILISRGLERIADHAANIATNVIFWVRGADVRHQLSLAVD